MVDLDRADASGHGRRRLAQRRTPASDRDQRPVHGRAFEVRRFADRALDALEEVGEERLRNILVVGFFFVVCAGIVFPSRIIHHDRL